MAAVGERKPFGDSLEDLESQADISYKYPSDDMECPQNKYIEVLINRAIAGMLNATRDYLRSGRTLEFSIGCRKCSTN